MTCLIRLSWPDKALQPHAKGHWRPKAKATKAARLEAWAMAREQAVATDPRAILLFTFHPPDERRRDLHNMPSQCKAYIDGIADAMGCGDRLFQCVWPTSFEQVVKGGCVLVHINSG